MPASYSFDLRTRILKDCGHGISSEDAARKYSVSITWVYNLKKQRKETGCIASEKYQPGLKRKLEPYEQEVRQLVGEPFQYSGLKLGLRCHRKVTMDCDCTHSEACV